MSDISGTKANLSDIVGQMPLRDFIYLENKL